MPELVARRIVNDFPSQIRSELQPLINGIQALNGQNGDTRRFLDRQVMLQGEMQQTLKATLDTNRAQYTADMETLQSLLRSSINPNLQTETKSSTKPIHRRTTSAT